jgi:pseudouridine-5'-phosphate glycosidase
VQNPIQQRETGQDPNAWKRANETDFPVVALAASAFTRGLNYAVNMTMRQQIRLT